jgi:flagellar basal-body rod protein FlgC
MDPVSLTMRIAASGLEAQSLRMRVVSENIANADSTAAGPNGDPYRRKTVVFENVLDRATGAKMVEIKKVGVDKTDFSTEFAPGHPAADENGYIQRPNVNSLVEMMDLREAGRSYEANLNVIEQARSMSMRTIDMLRA